MSTVVKQVFRMPLQSHKPLALGAFDGLDEKIIIYGCHLKIFAQALYGLAVYPVGADYRGTHKLSQTAGVHKSNGLHGQQQWPVPGIHPEGCYVLAQRATVKYVDKLRATADAEHGNPDRFCLFQQEIVGCIPGMIVTGTHLRFLAITSRMNMRAT